MLLTERLLLRTWTEDDVRAMFALSNDRDVMRYFTRVMTYDEAVAFVALQRDRLAAGELGLYAVEPRGGGPFLGFVGLAVPPYETAFTPCVEIGWRLVPDAWGHGYATEAARACLRHAFTTLDLDEVVSFTATINEPSQAVMRRIGMTRDLAGDFDHPRVPEGHPVRPHVLYRLTRAQWLDWTP